MPTKNQGRMAQDMKRELIAIIGGMKDPRITGGLLTVTRLDVTPDLDVAKVYISVMGREGGCAPVVKALNKASGHIRTGCTFARRPATSLWRMTAPPTPRTSARCCAALKTIPVTRRGSEPPLCRGGGLTLRPCRQISQRHPAAGKEVSYDRICGPANSRHAAPLGPGYPDPVPQEPGR